MKVARARGFTLIELIAVIALIGIGLVAAGIGVNQGLASARMRAAGVEVAGALRAVRAQAIVHARSETFDVDTRAGTWRTAQRAPVALPKGMRIAVTSAALDVQGDATGRIRFFPDGSSTGGHITLATSRRQWRIDVSWLTGEVRVHDVAAAQ